MLSKRLEGTGKSDKNESEYFLHNLQIDEAKFNSKSEKSWERSGKDAQNLLHASVKKYHSKEDSKIAKKQFEPHQAWVKYR